MTVKIISATQRFQGVASDDKPTTPPEGSTFHVIDTGEEYVFYDGGWTRDLRRIRAIQDAAV